LTLCFPGLVFAGSLKPATGGGDNMPEYHSDFEIEYLGLFNFMGASDLYLLDWWDFIWPMY